MSYSEIVSSLIALLAIVVSVASLYRTRQVNKRQLEMQDETARLARIQRDILERQEALRLEQEMRSAEKAEEIERERLEGMARGYVQVGSSLYFGVPSVVVRNSGSVFQ